MSDKPFPQLRLRSEFSFRKTFSPLKRLAEHAAALNAPVAAIVDGGTWGHVKWAQTAAQHNILPAFGREVEFRTEDALRRPTAWALAAAGNTAAFYRASTALERGAAPQEFFSALKGKGLRFAGAALTDPELFDYVDLAAGSPRAARNSLELSRRTGKPLILTSDNYYPSKADLPLFQGIGGRELVSPQHVMSLEELRALHRWLPDDVFNAAVQTTVEVSQQLAHELPKAPMIEFSVDLHKLCAEGKEYRLSRNHIPAWTEEYEQRLQRELTLIAEKKFESYFGVVSDLVVWAKERMLVGPARGSSGGSLVCYLLRITEIDPMPHKLLFERFIDINRHDLPDIDIDFSDTRRELCFEYLAEKYGKDNVARIGNVNRYRPRSLINDVCKRLGINDGEKWAVVNVLVEYSSGDSRFGHALEDTMTGTESGKTFLRKNPAAAQLFALENHATHTGIHAAGVIVSNVAVSDYCTVNAEGVAQLDKPDIDPLNLLKIDVLGLRTLGVIEDAGVVTSQQLYDLKLDDPATLAIFNKHTYAGIFQFEGQAQRRVAAQIEIKEFAQIDHCTALARPGPLGGGAAQEYIRRARGDEVVEYAHPLMEQIASETQGTVLYQEQTMLITRIIGGFSWEETSYIRKAMSGRKGYETFNAKMPAFMEGAKKQGVSEVVAHDLWMKLRSMGNWTMNKSHTCAYAIVSYWCAWMKAHHPLEYAAACLRNAKDDQQAQMLLRELVAEGVKYVAFDPELSEVNWSAKDGKLIGGFMNLDGVGAITAANIVAERQNGGIKKATMAKLAKANIKFKDLSPLHTNYHWLYADPCAHGCREGSEIVDLDKLPESGECLVLVQVERKEKRDENESMRVAKRGGKRFEGRTEFLDIFVTDDSGEPFTMRIDRFRYPSIGELASERIEKGDVLLIRGKRIPNFAMVKVERMKCINAPERLQ